jgi:hypothetical protein
MTLDNLDKKQAPLEMTKASDSDPVEIENLDLETTPGKKPPKNQPKIDVLLQETVNIMADYVDLWTHGKQKVSATKPPVAAN